MNISFKITLIFFCVLFGVTLITSYLYYGDISLLTFINTSFLYSSILIFLSLLTLVTQKGFFDGITYSFRRIFASSQADKQLEHDIRNEMRPPSELLQPLSTQPMLMASLLLFLCMLGSLFVYYSS
ncbi:DUF3899 domain-containing protein [Bacillus sp. LL01]|uniref:DUF3899 domain-containing protein n=1 Tax=Bacillus sp. LL01 TaxID=1665556 RepID=UPI00069FEBE7|nr:DUF3899 domain-containing protein [Bacillus sp. LL01]